jgi:hypothetical protein
MHTSVASLSQAELQSGLTENRLCFLCAMPIRILTPRSRQRWNEHVLSGHTHRRWTDAGRRCLASHRRWLNTHQPISLAVNGDYELMLALWEHSGLVVNTVG